MDDEKHILARCIGHPDDFTWGRVCEEVLAAMEKAFKDMGKPQRSPDGRRGFFNTLFFGYSMGGGQTASLLSHPSPVYSLTRRHLLSYQEPTMMDMKNDKNRRVEEELRDNPWVRRMVQHTTGTFLFYSTHCVRSFLNLPLCTW